MRYWLILLYSLFSFFTIETSAQYYNTGQDPGSLKWLQIKTGRFTVIFPKEYASGGIEFARSLDESYSKLLTLYPERKFKIPVVIHNHSVQPNGYVAWAPRRMEIYPTPEQNTIPLDPVKQLTLHELTHVFQMTSLKKGFSNVASLILGEQVTGIIASLLPLWFLEGQAVFAETFLTQTGRGRSPAFQKQLKAIAVERERFYKYDKILNGSYRDYVPDHYQTGYQMVTWAMVKYEPAIWNKVINFTATQPFTINPVDISLRRNAGIKKKSLFKETFDTLKTLWTDEISDNKTRAYNILNPQKKKDHINYYSPVSIGSGRIVAIKTSLTEPAQFVLLNPEKKTEKKIHIPGQVYPYFISYSNNLVVWVETQSDHRWENRKYSVVKSLNIINGRTKRLTKKSRYLAASISPDGSRIAAIENATENINKLVFLDVKKGSVLNTVYSPDNMNLQRPQWSDDGEKITFISLSENGEGVAVYAIRDNKWEFRVRAGREDLQASFLRNDSLFFISSLSGTDNIYLSTPDRKNFKLTESKFGVSDMSLAGNTLLFSDYSLEGNNISSAPLAATLLPLTDNKDSSSYLINKVIINKIPGEINSEKSYDPVPYRKWKHLFRIHSWMPFYADLEEIKADPASIRPGAAIISQNSLSTLVTSLGYEYSAEKKHVFHSRVTWMGWLPVIESRLDYGNNPVISKTPEDADPSIVQPRLRSVNTISLPLSFSSGRFSEYLRPSISSDYRNDLIFNKNENYYDSDQTILAGRLFFSNVYRYAHRDIYPKWGQVVDMNYSFAPFDKDIYGRAFTLKTTFYFPGFLRDNGIKIRYEKEKQNPARFYYGNKVPHPRGYKDIISMELDYMSIDYVMPVAYPDFNLSSFLYLKRIRTGLFYDYAVGRDNTYYIQDATGMHPFQRNRFKENFKSYGIEVLADFHILRIPYMISGGVQTAWKTESDRPSFMLLFNIDLYGMTIGRR